MRPLVPLVTSWQGLTPSRPHSPTPCTHPKPSLPAPTVHAPHSPSVPPGHSPTKSPPLAPAAERRFPGRHRPLPAAPGRCRGRPQLCVGARSPAGGPPAAAPHPPTGSWEGERGDRGGGRGRLGTGLGTRGVTVALSPRHPITPSPHHPVTPSPCHLLPPSRCHPTTPPPRHPISAASTGCRNLPPNPPAPRPQPRGSRWAGPPCAAHLTGKPDPSSRDPPQPQLRSGALVPTTATPHHRRLRSPLPWAQAQ